MSSTQYTFIILHIDNSYVKNAQQITRKLMKKMGINFSEPIPNFGEDLGYIAIVVRCLDRLRLLHAPKCVVEMVQRVLG